LNTFCGLCFEARGTLVNELETGFAIHQEVDGRRGQEADSQEGWHFAGRQINAKDGHTPALH
jgi:hypothetical protein